MSTKVRHLVKRVLFRARKDINRTADKNVQKGETFSQDSAFQDQQGHQQGVLTKMSAKRRHLAGRNLVK
jgi:hypothetical protein